MIYVVFTNRREGWLINWLKPGFKHCFVLVQSEGVWVEVDPTDRSLDIRVTPFVEGMTIADFYREELGDIVVPVKSYGGKSRLGIYSCVAATKRVIGLDDWRVWTPWQLYKRITGVAHAG